MVLPQCEDAAGRCGAGFSGATYPRRWPAYVLVVLLEFLGPPVL